MKKETLQKAPELQANRTSRRATATFKVTARTCNVWHPLVRVQSETQEGSKFAATCAFLHTDTETPSKKKSRNDPNSDTTNICDLTQLSKIGLRVSRL